MIPPNISDPLNLNNCVDENDYENSLISPSVPNNGRRRFRYRKKRVR